MQVVHTVSQLRAFTDECRAGNRRIGFVPTMGALHEGHLSLVRTAKERAEIVLVSIFVNPTQFGPNEDFEKYPRSVDADCELLRNLDVDLVFVPDRTEMYPPDCETYIGVGSTAESWEGTLRPGHFQGVATVVLKLFNLVRADIAFFGQKDFQQLAVIRRMIKDLNIPVELVACPTVRESDGLAMSSRNRYLGDEERKQALVLFHSLKKAEEMVLVQKVDGASQIRGEMEKIIHSAKDAKIDYIALVDPKTLQEVDRVENSRPLAVLLAVRIGATRLIDNILLEM